VFGEVKWTYPFPFYLRSAMPLGDGIVWTTRKEIFETKPSSSERRKPFSGFKKDLGVGINMG
jgi:hypothetical protein